MIAEKRRLFFFFGAKATSVVLSNIIVEALWAGAAAAPVPAKGATRMMLLCSFFRYLNLTLPI